MKIFLYEYLGKNSDYLFLWMYFSGLFKLNGCFARVNWKTFFQQAVLHFRRQPRARNGLGHISFCINDLTRNNVHSQERWTFAASPSGSRKIEQNWRALSGSPGVRKNCLKYLLFRVTLSSNHLFFIRSESLFQYLLFYEGIHLQYEISQTFRKFSN